MAGKDHHLDAAYRLRTPEDSRQFYDGWAEGYERDFAQGMDYRSPEAVAAAFAALGGGGPVLDLGAGTGLVGAALAARGIAPLDALDISPAMLRQAEAKGIYRRCLVADLMADLPLPDASYRGIVSAGTFTSGHVGPAAFPELLRIAAPGAILAVTVHAAFYEQAGFAEAFARLGARIGEFATRPFRIYGPRAEGPHRDDTGWIVSFRRL